MKENKFKQQPGMKIYKVAKILIVGNKRHIFFHEDW